MTICSVDFSCILLFSAVTDSQSRKLLAAYNKLETHTLLHVGELRALTMPLREPSDSLHHNKLLAIYWTYVDLEKVFDSVPFKRDCLPEFEGEGWTK